MKYLHFSHSVSFFLFINLFNMNQLLLISPYLCVCLFNSLIFLGLSSSLSFISTIHCNCQSIFFLDSLTRTTESSYLGSCPSENHLLLLYLQTKYSFNHLFINRLRLFCKRSNVSLMYVLLYRTQKIFRLHSLFLILPMTQWPPVHNRRYSYQVGSEIF